MCGVQLCVCVWVVLQPVAVLRYNALCLRTNRNTNMGVCDVCLCVRLQQFAALRYNKLCMRTNRITVSLVVDMVCMYM